MKKISVILLISLLIFQFVPKNIFASEIIENKNALLTEETEERILKGDESGTIDDEEEIGVGETTFESLEEIGVNDPISEFNQHQQEILNQFSEEKESTSSNMEEKEAGNKQSKVDLVSDDLEETKKLPAQTQKTSEITIYASTQQFIQLTGIAVSKTTPVYANMDRTKVLKNYKQGHILKYRPFTDEWHQATVYIDGELKKGYINTKDVETETSSPKTLQGIGIKGPTKVYAKASTTAKTLKNYKNGHILKYRTFTSNWYAATVYINGKANTGYIHAKDVETIATPQNLQGVGLRDSTPIYVNASTSSRILKTYSYGHVLKYRTFTSNWYAATVYINGKPQTGYIYKNDVVGKNVALTGYGKMDPTTVYSGTSKNSTKLKSYAIGSTLKYRPYKNGWFQATVMYNGKWTTGYISTKDVGPNKPVIYGYGHASPTTVYSKTSKNSTKLKSYQLGASLKYRPYNNKWYEATVKHNGKWVTGYIHKDDVASTKPKLNVADKLNTVSNNNQLILVTSKGYNTSKAKIETYERDAKGRWILRLSVSGHIGKNGFATDKTEGDGKSPVGKYSIGTAFGQKGDPGTKLSFRSITSDDVWVDDPNSQLYNTWQSRSKTSSQWNSAESMDHRLYTYGFVINYNKNPIVRNKGSAIFLHTGNSYTVGCTATSEANVISIMQWLDPKKNPVIIQTPEARLGSY